MKPFLLSLICCATLFGCQFKLRDQKTFPPQLQGLYLESDQPYDQLTLNLKQTLLLLGLKPTSSIKETTVILRVFNIALNYSEPALNASNQARTYSLNYQLNFELSKGGKALLPAQTISLQRSLIVNPNETLYSNNEANTLKREMQQEAINLLLYRLESNKIRHALQTPS